MIRFTLDRTAGNIRASQNPTCPRTIADHSRRTPTSERKVSARFDFGNAGATGGGVPADLPWTRTCDSDQMSMCDRLRLRAVSKRLVAHRLRRLLMLRLSRALVIQDLERLVEDSIIGRTEWSAKGVDCRRERHGHSSPAYSFDLDILNLRATGGPGAAWEVFIVTEFLAFGAGDKPAQPQMAQAHPRQAERRAQVDRGASGCGGQAKGTRGESLTSTRVDALSGRAQANRASRGLSARRTATRTAPPGRAPPRFRAGDCIWRCARCGSPSRS